MTNKPSLKGKKILITREKSQANALVTLVHNYQGIPIKVPLLNITCRANTGVILGNKKVNTYDWIFFTSAHGVNCFFAYFSHDVDFKATKFATVGHKTEEALNKHGYFASFIPSIYNAEVMADEFFKQFPDGNNILLVRGNMSRQLLIDELTDRKLDFGTLVVYDTTYFHSMKAMLLHVLTTEKLDYVTFTSPSTVKAFIEMVEDHPLLEQFLQIPTICIGTTTEKTAIDFQFKQTFIPDSFTVESMVKKMLALETKK